MDRRISAIPDPELLCDGSKNDNYYTKINNREVAEEELRHSQIIQRIDPRSEFTLPILKICPLPAKFRQDIENGWDTLLIFHRRGLSLMELDHVSQEMAVNIVIALTQFCDSMIALNQHGLLLNNYELDSYYYDKYRKKIYVGDFEDLTSIFEDNDMEDTWDQCDMIMAGNNNVAATNDLKGLVRLISAFINKTPLQKTLEFWIYTTWTLTMSLTVTQKQLRDHIKSLGSALVETDLSDLSDIWSTSMVVDLPPLVPLNKPLPQLYTFDQIATEFGRLQRAVELGQELYQPKVGIQKLTDWIKESTYTSLIRILMTLDKPSLDRIRSGLRAVRIMSNISN